MKSRFDSGSFLYIIIMVELYGSTFQIAADIDHMPPKILIRFFNFFDILLGVFIPFYPSVNEK